MLDRILQNAISDVRVDGIADAFLTPVGSIAGQFFSDSRTYNFEIIGSRVYYHNLEYRQDGKGKKCPRGYWIPREHKCSTGIMTPSATKASKDIKKTLKTRAKKYNDFRNRIKSDKPETNKHLQTRNALSSKIQEAENELDNLWTKQKQITNIARATIGKRESELVQQKMKAEGGRQLTPEEVKAIRNQAWMEIEETFVRSEEDKLSKERLEWNKIVSDAEFELSDLDKRIAAERKNNYTVSRNNYTVSRNHEVKYSLSYREERQAEKEQIARLADMKSTKAIQVLKEEESRIRNEPIEHSVNIDPISGKILCRNTGDEDSVGIKREDIPYQKGSISTHNHPGAWGSLSDADVRFACLNELAEIRSVTSGYRFSMKPPKEGWDFRFWGKNKEIFEKEMERLYEESWNKIKAEDLPLTKKEEQIRTIYIYNKAWKKFAKETGARYSVEYIPGEPREREEKTSSKHKKSGKEPSPGLDR